MAVEKQRVIDRLKALFGAKANFSTERLNEISERLSAIPEDGADDATIDAFLNQANAIHPFDLITKTDDKIRGLEAKLPKPAPAPAPTPGGEPTPTPGDDTPKWAQAILASNEALAKKVEAFETGKVVSDKRAEANKLFEASETLKHLNPAVKANWMSRVDVNSETPADEQIKALETEFTTMQQNFADSIGHAGGLPIVGAPTGAPSAKDVASIVDNLVG